MRSSLKCLLFSTALYAFAVGTAPAAVILETEPNDTLGTAQNIVTSASSIQIQGERTFNDPSDDFFSFFVSAPGLLRITSSSPDPFADSIMGLFGPGGMLLASNDDGGDGTSMSSIEFLVTSDMTGLYTIGFSGFNPGLLACVGAVTECYDTDNDFLFDTFVAGGGAGGSTGWAYTINIAGLNVVPEPGSLALLALGLPAVILLDRRRARGRKAGAHAA